MRQINGVEVNNLATLVEVAEACKEKYIKVELDYNQASSPCLRFLTSISRIHPGVLSLRLRVFSMQSRPHGRRILAVQHAIECRIRLEC